MDLHESTWATVLPVPLRLPGGRFAVGTPSMLATLRLWRGIPELRRESAQVLEAYDGGDVLDVGALHGWYSMMLAPLARPGSRLVSFEPDRRASASLSATLGV